MGSVASRCNGAAGGVTEVVLEREKGKMRRQEMGWKEVTLTLTAPGRLVHSESHPITQTPPQSNSPRETTVRVKRPVSLPARLKEVAQQVRYFGQRHNSSVSKIDTNIHSSTTSLESTYKDFDSDSGEYESAGTLRPKSISLRAVTAMSSESICSKRSKSSTRPSPLTQSKMKTEYVMMSVEERLNNWSEALKSALMHDKIGYEREALEYYSQ